MIKKVNKMLDFQSEAATYLPAKLVSAKAPISSCRRRMSRLLATACIAFNPHMSEESV